MNNNRRRQAASGNIKHRAAMEHNRIKPAWTNDPDESYIAFCYCLPLPRSLKIKYPDTWHYFVPPREWGFSGSRGMLFFWLEWAEGIFLKRACRHMWE